MIFLDVDGVLLPWHRAGEPDPADGPRLRTLPGPLIWATTWGERANEIIAPALGLPRLPVVDFPDDPPPTGGGVHWKTADVVRYAAGRPFVWLDDEITAADGWWVEAHHPGPALLHRVEGSVGLTGDDLDAVRQWLARH